MNNTPLRNLELLLEFEQSNTILGKKPKIPTVLCHSPITAQFRKFESANIIKLLPDACESWKCLLKPSTAKKVVELVDIKDNSVDVFFSYRLLDFIAETKLFLKNILRVLTKSGRAIIQIKQERLTYGPEEARVAYEVDKAGFGLSEDESLPSMTMGRDWLIEEFAKLGATADFFEFEILGVTGVQEWLVVEKKKPEVKKADTDIRLEFMVPVVKRIKAVVPCVVCEADISKPKGRETCPNCGSLARTRTLFELMREHSDWIINKKIAKSKPCLAFAMTSIERVILEKHFSDFTSVSLYGNYGVDHIKGVDARDLARFEDESFSSHFSILLFDYFTETDRALEEAFRVVARGGNFITCIGAYRLVDGEKETEFVSKIVPRHDYFNYIPEGGSLDNVRISRQYFISLMTKVGFENCRHIQYTDGITGDVCEWFVGVKP